MAIITIKDKNGNLIDIPALQGKSAYQYAKEQGFVGTEEEFAQTLIKENIDVQVNGTSIVTDGVANVPRASTSEFGVIKLGNNHGLSWTGDILAVSPATNANINGRTNMHKPIAPSNMDYAVKQAMTDGKGAEWTTEEKASARARMGMEWKLLGDVTIEEGGVTMIEIPIDNPNYNEYQFSVVLADRIDTTNKQILVNFDSLTTNTYALASFNVGSNKNYSGRGYTQRNCNNGWFTVAIGGTGNQQASTMTTITGRANNYSANGASWNTESPTAINAYLATGLDIGTRFVVYAR